MIHRSVIAKLWLTIMGLIFAILLFLSIVLIKYFDHYYYVEQASNLNNLGSKIANILERHSDKDEAINTALEFADVFETNMVITATDKKGKLLPIEGLFTNEDLNKLFFSNEKTIRLKIKSAQNNNLNDIIAVGVPIYSFGKLDGGIILYQSLDNLYETTDYLKKTILLLVGFTIIATTVFAFFLSTRITAPVLEMQKAANLMAKGDFHTKVPIKTGDEIGDLAQSFNQMASQLEETVQALSTEKDKLANILKSMADGVITFNTIGEIIVINPPAENLLNPQNDHLPDSLKKMLNTVLVQKINLKEDINFNGRILSVVMAPLYSGKTISGAVTLLRDVTYERKLDKLRKDFLANVSHELRTPISMMQGYSEAIIDDIAGTQEEKKDLAQIIYDESLRMGRLVNELLDLAKMESGNYQLQYCKVDIEKMLLKVNRKFIALANELGIKLSIDIDSNLYEMYFDADRIEQVLTNLIDNAFRHTPTGGKIILRAKLKPDGKLLLEVEDSGEGIPEEDLPFIFERFYKADKARTRNQSGTGLGLSIVKNIVEAHGGNISVASKIGQGTTFSIILPIKRILTV